MNTTNIPIQMIACCGTFGDFLPLRFRYEDAEHKLQTVDKIEVIAEKEVQYAGQEAFIFTCKAPVGGEEKLFEVKYVVKSHKWFFCKML